MFGGGGAIPGHGFEPRFTVPKTAVLPLDEPGVLRSYLMYMDAPGIEPGSVIRCTDRPYVRSVGLLLSAPGGAVTTPVCSRPSIRPRMSTAPHIRSDHSIDRLPHRSGAAGVRLTYAARASSVLAGISVSRINEERPLGTLPSAAERRRNRSRPLTPPAGADPAGLHTNPPSPARLRSTAGPRQNPNSNHIHT
jgi:hypothetical protein